MKKPICLRITSPLIAGLIVGLTGCASSDGNGAPADAASNDAMVHGSDASSAHMDQEDAAHMAEDAADKPDDGVPGVPVSPNNTVVSHSDDDAEGHLTKAHAWESYGGAVTIAFQGKYGLRSSGSLLLLTLGPGTLPTADRTYDLQGILFDQKNEKAYVQIDLGGSADTWQVRSGSAEGAKLYAKVNNNGTTTFYFNNLTLPVSQPPYMKTKIFSGRVTLPADFAIGGIKVTNSDIYDLVD